MWPMPVASQESTMLEQYEPSACDCTQCRQQCRSPGVLAPGDLERICAHVGMDPEDIDFTSAVFQAGPQVPIEFGTETAFVPTIIPAQRDSGECVFYREGRCTIHRVRPFGCSRVNACEGGNDAAIDECVRESAADMEYLNHWTALAVKQCVDAEPKEFP